MDPSKPSPASKIFKKKTDWKNIAKIGLKAAGESAASEEDRQNSDLEDERYSNRPELHDNRAAVERLLKRARGETEEI